VDARPRRASLSVTGIHMSAMTLEQASTIVDVALREARKQNMSPLCIVVLDPGASPVALKREDRASMARPQVATAKAAGCLAMGFGGREIARRAQSAPTFYAALNGLFPHGLLPVPGGVLIRDAMGVVVGAVGVTGDTSDNDELCAVAGINAAGLVADTGAPKA
jgi:uncharacterized protein GlcG (DUF336 family)